MTPPIRVFLNPDHCHELGSFVLVPGATGVQYEVQCGGLRNEVRVEEGFLVSVGPVSAFAQLTQWVMCRYHDYAQYPANGWSDAHVDELRRRVAAVTIWTEQGERSGPVRLTLDESRLQDCIEAWIPVVTPYGPGWADNSD